MSHPFPLSRRLRHVLNLLEDILAETKNDELTLKKARSDADDRKPCGNDNLPHGH